MSYLGPQLVLPLKVNSTAVNVLWAAPSNDNGIDRYVAYTETYFTSSNCTAEKSSANCTISGLEPYHSYTICVKACHINEDRTEVANRQLTKEKLICSTSTCGDVMTLPSCKN